MWRIKFHAWRRMTCSLRAIINIPRRTKIVRCGNLITLGCVRKHRRIQGCSEIEIKAHVKRKFTQYFIFFRTNLSYRHLSNYFENQLQKISLRKLKFKTMCIYHSPIKLHYLQIKYFWKYLIYMYAYQTSWKICVPPSYLCAHCGAMKFVNREYHTSHFKWLYTFFLFSSCTTFL